ncbi:hypothetical protein PQI51_09790 [Microbacterium esteraromaticum]|uniref:hypothetical protein n=1 Tax=Microbacterium esteraromaticum TaxID=57043 RepID=UPI0030A3D2BA
MTMTTTLVRTGSAMAVAGLLIAMLSACTPEAKPTPEPTKTAAFATDEEAFAAAEETYRAFVKAQNSIDLTDEATFEPVYDLTVDDAYIAIRESLTQLQAQGVTMSGASKVASVKPLAADLPAGKVSMHVCVDVSATDLVDSEGESVVPANRADVQSLLVDFEVQDARGVKVSRTTGDDTPCPG